MRSDLIDIEVQVHHETSPGEENDGAYLVSTSTSSPRKEWIPKSRCELSDVKPAPSKQATMTLPQSLAEEKGLV